MLQKSSIGLLVNNILPYSMFICSIFWSQLYSYQDITAPMKSFPGPYCEAKLCVPSERHQNDFYIQTRFEQLVLGIDRDRLVCPILPITPLLSNKFIRIEKREATKRYTWPYVYDTSTQRGGKLNRILDEPRIAVHCTWSHIARGHNHMNIMLLMSYHIIINLQMQCRNEVVQMQQL